MGHAAQEMIPSVYTWFVKDGQNWLTVTKLVKGVQKLCIQYVLKMLKASFKKTSRIVECFMYPI